MQKVRILITVFIVVRMLEFWESVHSIVPEFEQLVGFLQLHRICFVLYWTSFNFVR
jgi:hypothetical protein